MEEHAALHGLRAPSRVLPVDAAVLYRLVSCSPSLCRSHFATRALQE